MGFKKTEQELKEYFQIDKRVFNDAQMMGVMFNSKMDIVRELIPAPLEPVESASGLIFIAEYKTTNLGPGYKEAGLLLKCRYKSEEGTYCLSMPIDNEARMFNGRDIFGFPKKLAKIEFKKDGQNIYASVERNGIKFIEIETRIASSLPDFPPTGPSFTFKAMPRVDLKEGFDGPVLLVRQQTEIKVKSLDIGMSKVQLVDSDSDPWSSLQIANPSSLMGFYMVSDNTMLPGSVLTEVDPKQFLPHYFKMTDFYSKKGNL